MHGIALAIPHPITLRRRLATGLARYRPSLHLPQGSPLRIDVPCSQCLTAEHQRFACVTDGLQRYFLPVVLLGLLHGTALLMYW